jgi:hypothetical protein
VLRGAAHMNEVALNYWNSKQIAKKQCLFAAASFFGRAGEFVWKLSRGSISPSATLHFSLPFRQ